MKGIEESRGRQYKLGFEGTDLRSGREGEGKGEGEGT